MAREIPEERKKFWREYLEIERKQVPAWRVVGKMTPEELKAAQERLGLKPQSATAETPEEK